MLDSSSPPSWLRPVSLRWVDLADEYLGAAARRLCIADGPSPQTPDWRQAWSDVVYSRRTLEALAEVGVTAVCLHYDEGFGRVAQADDVRHAAQFAGACRELGLRVFARIEAGALYYETLLRDRPGLAAWAQRDARGDIRHVEGGLPAWRPCYRSRGFLELLRDSVSLACEQLHADGVVLANFGPHDCHCERCQQGFRRMLAQRHPEPRKTLGLPSLDHVRLPLSPSPADPLSCEAARFSVRVLRSALAEVRIHLRSISAHLALWAEPRPGEASASCAAFYELCAPLDVVTWRAEPVAEGHRIGVLAARCLAGHGTRTFVHTGGGRSREGLAASLGAAMAFGGHVLAHDQALRCHDGAAGTPAQLLTPAFVADRATREAWAQCLEFAARHEHYHHRAECLAEVALAFSEADVAAGPEAWGEMQRAQWALLRAVVPFHLVPLAAVRPDRHRLVVIAGQARVTNEEASALCALAQEGLPVVLVGDAGACDPWGRRRAQSAFKPIHELPHVRRVRGNGVPQAIAEAIRALLPHPPVVALDGPTAEQGSVYVCPFRLPTGQAAIHLLNAADRPIDGLRLHVRADLAPSRHVAWHQPESADALLDCTLDGASISTALPPLSRYALVVTS